MWRENVYIEITPNIFYSKLSTMNVPKSFLLYGGLLLLMSACSPSLSPFTQKLYDQNDWTETDLREVFIDPFGTNKYPGDKKHLQ